MLRQFVFFRETVELEKALLNQTCTAIDATYYKERISLHTNTVIENLSIFLAQLFTSYGDIHCERTKEEEKKVLEILYDLQYPITNVLEPIKDLEQLVISGNRPYTQEQLVDVGVTIISNTHDFEAALVNWYSLPPINQKWARFKTNFPKLEGT